MQALLAISFLTNCLNSKPTSTSLKLDYPLHDWTFPQTEQDKDDLRKLLYNKQFRPNIQLNRQRGSNQDYFAPRGTQAGQEPWWVVYYLGLRA